MTREYSITDIQPLPPKARSRGAVKDLTGQIINGLTVLGFLGLRQRKYASASQWLVRCPCGTLFAIDRGGLKHGTRSCGCYMKTQFVPSNKRHGMSHKPEHNIWGSMRSRCENPNNKSYPRYGGRGITVCDRWQSFDNFFADMGLRPSPQHELERKDNNGNYSPENCIWATHQKNSNNRRNNHTLTWNGKTQTLAEWGRELGLSGPMIESRLRQHKWSIEKALTTPKMSRADAGRIACKNRWG